MMHRSRLSRNFHGPERTRGPWPFPVIPLINAIWKAIGTRLLHSPRWLIPSPPGALKNHEFDLHRWKRNPSLARCSFCRVYYREVCSLNVSGNFLVESVWIDFINSSRHRVNWIIESLRRKIELNTVISLPIEPSSNWDEYWTLWECLFSNKDSLM